VSLYQKFKKGHSSAQKKYILVERGVSLYQKFKKGHSSAQKKYILLERGVSLYLKKDVSDVRMYDIIMKKRDGGELTREEIDFFVKGYVAGDIPDYQVSALLMAVYFQGMNDRETSDLTMSMVHSGDVVDLSSIPGKKVDKHSTGGVGDTTTLIVAPLVAACGVPVAKMSGRGLGHTGGTLDKLESIPGLKIDLSMEQFIKIVNHTGLAVMGQTKNLVPADKLLYALRDVTATVDNMSLIASSIMSKKIAAGADAIVLDVKTGSGAFMQNPEDAFSLAKAMVGIGSNVGRKTIALVTDMNQPLGQAVGNALEVKEAIDVLKGRVTGQLREVSLLLASYMLCAADRCSTLDEARKMAEDALVSGKGAQKLKEMIRAQSGDERVVDDTSLLPQPRRIMDFKADRKGYINTIDTQAVGMSALLLGAGRTTKEDSIDVSVGIVMSKRLGDYVDKGETIARFYVSKEDQLNEALEIFRKAIELADTKPDERPLVYGVVTDGGVEKWM